MPLTTLSSFRPANFLSHTHKHADFEYLMYTLLCCFIPTFTFFCWSLLLVGAIVDVDLNTQYTFSEAFYTYLLLPPLIMLVLLFFPFRSENCKFPFNRSCTNLLSRGTLTQRRVFLRLISMHRETGCWRTYETFYTETKQVEFSVNQI